MNLYNAYFSVGDALYGTGLVAPHKFTGKAPPSIAYFCPSCGEIWGKVFFKETINNWKVIPRKCEEHGCGLLQPDAYNASFLSMDEKMLKREILIWDSIPQNKLWVAGRY